MKSRRIQLVVHVLLAIVLGSPLFAQTVGTSFTYQGQLKESGVPLTDTADFEFRLFNALMGGTQIGSTVPMNNVNVVDGAFTVSLDFGSSVFNGDSRWLQISVRSPAGSGNFTTLTSRQMLSATPYALYALTGPGSGGPWATNGNHVSVTNTGGVGIGTTTPATTVHVKKFQPVIVLQDTNTNSQQASYLGFWNNSGVETGWIGFGSPGIPDLYVVNGRSAGDIRLIPGPGGEVRLDSEQYPATAGEESLRIVRGNISENGAILEGTGFSVQHLGESHYLVTFNRAFADVPTITATGDRIPFTPGGFASNAAHFVMADSVTTASTEFYTRSNLGENGEWTSRPFQFIAIGPR